MNKYLTHKTQFKLGKLIYNGGPDYKLYIAKVISSGEAVELRPGDEIAIILTELLETKYKSGEEYSASLTYVKSKYNGTYALDIIDKDFLKMAFPKDKNNKDYALLFSEVESTFEKILNRF